MMKQACLFTFLFLLFLCTGALPAGQSGTGFTFLSLGVGGRSLGMGEAYTTASGDPAAMHFNPATLSLVGHTTVTATHRDWIQGTSAEYIAGAATFNKLAVGISVSYVSIPDIEIRTVPGPAVGTFSARNAAIGLSASYKASGNLAIGATVKYLYEKILIDNATGIAFDFGGIYMLPHDIRVGLSLVNLGSVNALRYEESTLPRSLRGGVSYSNTLENLPAVITGSMDFISPLEEGDAHLHFGIEARLYESVAIRAGYQTGYEARSLTLGTGFASGIVAVDYAFIPTQYNLGSTHAISLSLVIR